MGAMHLEVKCLCAEHGNTLKEYFVVEIMSSSIQHTLQRYRAPATGSIDLKGDFMNALGRHPSPAVKPQTSYLFSLALPSLELQLAFTN